jgi:hypothetical protein
MSAYLSAHQAAAHCGVNEKTVRRWIKRGRLRADKRDGVYRVALEDVTALCGQRRGMGGPGPVGGGQAAAPEDELSGSGTGTGPGNRADMPRGNGEAPELAGLVRELMADVRRLSEAATLWQTRSAMLAEELAAARATIRALEAPREAPTNAPQSHQDARETATPAGVAQESTPVPSGPWWRRLWTALSDA